MIKDYGDIPGWFWWLDRRMFETALEAQAESAPGALVELGTYLGKSAVIIGNFLRAGDRFVALDLFGRDDLLTDSADAVANRSENQKSYKTLPRQQFEANYLALHPRLPEILEALSSDIVHHVAPGGARFVHIDASHLYSVVRVDAVNARSLLRPGGMVVFDDWRAEHTPGVSAAVWEAVFVAGLIPVALTARKFYGVFSDPEPYRRAFAALVEGDQRLWCQEQQIALYPVLRIGQHETKATSKPPELVLNEAAIDGLAAKIAARLEPVVAAAGRAAQRDVGPAGVRQGDHPVRPGQRKTPEVAGTRPRRLTRSVVRDVAPPALTRWARSRRRSG